MTDQPTGQGATHADLSGPNFGPQRVHLPALDGIRGVAIGLVLFHHLAMHVSTEHPIGAFFRGFAHAGWCGVDLFFVLSGFLITGILFDTKRSPSRFRNFYVRRVLRIFPLYYAFLAVVFLVLPRFGAADGLGFSGPVDDQHWFWLYLTNVLIVVRDQWPSRVVGPLWSLAVEEQFYLIWPLIVFSFRRTMLMRVCVAMIVVALALRGSLIFAGVTQKANYVLLFTRMDTLAMGAWLALALRGDVDRRQLASMARWTLAVSCLVLGLLVLRNHTLSQWGRAVQTVGYSSIAGCSTALLALTVLAPSTSWLARFCSHGVLRMFGRHSYAVYVMHVPIIIAVAEGWFDPREKAWDHGAHLLWWAMFCAVAIGGSLVAALLSWHLLERHFLAMKRYFV